ncbi:Holliday junction resolvase [Candidatus Woesearchaeota archaeon]|nr:Holliday junction resolvase [Candidatus Woesearchaeota archaeon]
MTNRSKAKGSNVERELISMFWSREWGAIRVAGSGSMSFPSPDVLASNKIRIIAVECKFVNGDKKYFPRDEVEQLELFAEKFGAEPWIGVKFSRKSWYFLRTKDLGSTKGMFLASLELCQKKGMSFDCLIEYNHS